MDERQGPVVVDPVDQLVPPPGGRARLALLVAGAFVLLGVAAVAPVSGAVRPNLAFSGSETGMAGRGIGEWQYAIENEGWTTATIESFDLGLPGVEVVDTELLPAAPTPELAPGDAPANHPPDTAGPAVDGPIAVAAGQRVVVHLRFRYDCALQGAVQRSTVQARGITPLWLTTDLGDAWPYSLANLIDFACDHPD